MDNALGGLESIGRFKCMGDFMKRSTATITVCSLAESNGGQNSTMAAAMIEYISRCLGW
jgi:hypothetical protein